MCTHCCGVFGKKGTDLTKARMQNLIDAFPNVEWNFKTRVPHYYGYGDRPAFEVMGVHKSNPHVTVTYRWRAMTGASAKCWVNYGSERQMYLSPTSFKKVKDGRINDWIELIADGLYW